MLLYSQLGTNWFPELIIITGNGYLPYHYKIDLGNPVLKIAIEIDGGSHCSYTAKRRDLRKTNFLKSIGYRVLRFTNQQVLEDLINVKNQILSII